MFFSQKTLNNINYQEKYLLNINKIQKKCFLYKSYRPYYTEAFMNIDLNSARSTRFIMLFLPLFTSVKRLFAERNDAYQM